eukprot:snap_masked-scaffold60_size442463-processed-gene-1.5 protein:Tk12071 transcript:snap_masked-scaffold60_size442463-processed-gene-1.5-mRNA-1 annotation:"necap-like protein cg9132-like isoform 1"
MIIRQILKSCLEKSNVLTWITKSPLELTLRRTKYVPQMLNSSWRKVSAVSLGELVGHEASLLGSRIQGDDPRFVLGIFPVFQAIPCLEAENLRISPRDAGPFVSNTIGFVRQGHHLHRFPRQKIPTMETTILIKQEAFVYKIPAQGAGNAVWKANSWNLDRPDWTGKLRLVSQDKDCVIKLEDKTSGKLYAECPVDVYPGLAVQNVSDSSRYFVIRVSEDGGRTAHLGLGFADRADSFDVNVSLQEHFKGIKVEAQIQKESEAPQEFADLSLKEGETIKVNINIPKKGKRERSRSPAVATSSTPGKVLPPPKVNIADAVAAAGLQVQQGPRIDAPPTKTAANPNWIQF